jgi:hypothetical protein
VAKRRAESGRTRTDEPTAFPARLAGMIPDNRNRQTRGARWREALPGIAEPVLPARRRHNRHLASWRRKTRRPVTYMRFVPRRPDTGTDKTAGRLVGGDIAKRRAPRELGEALRFH